MKPVQFAVALVVPNPKNEKEVLAVLRPPTDLKIPNIWGLPAVVVKEGELPEDAAIRVGVEKLSSTVKPISYVGIQSMDRGEYELILMDIKVKLTGPEPSVTNAPTTGTKYVDQKWTSDYSIFIKSAQEGSVCSRIFLQSQGIDWGM